MKVTARAPVFLDRDGTLIVEKHYLHDPDQVQLEAGVLDGLRLLQEHGHPLIVVSNQSGIARGLFDAPAVRQVNARMGELLQNGGVAVTAWYFCPHVDADGCDCRKPRPGMPLAAARDCGVRLAGSYVIGDTRADLELADAIGGLGLLVASGHGARAMQWARAQARPTFERFNQAAAFIVADTA